MALRTSDTLVSTCQRKSRGGVVELRARPRAGAMASLTGCREASLHVVRIARTVEILLVAADTIRRRPLVLSVYVTLRTLQRHMCARQGKAGHRSVVEFGTLPSSCVVTLLAGLRESGSNVIRILGAREVLLMAADAIRRSTLILPANVT
jgi:hypothetical protein